MKALSLKTVLQKAVIYLDGRHVTFKTLKQERAKSKMKGTKHVSMIDAFMVEFSCLWLKSTKNKKIRKGCNKQLLIYEIYTTGLCRKLIGHVNPQETFLPSPALYRTASK